MAKFSVEQDNGWGVMVSKGGMLIGICVEIDTDAKTFKRLIIPEYEGPFFGTGPYRHPDPKMAALGWREERGTYDEIWALSSAPKHLLDLYAGLGIPVYDGRYATPYPALPPMGEEP